MVFSSSPPSTRRDFVLVKEHKQLCMPGVDNRACRVDMTGTYMMD